MVNIGALLESLSLWPSTRLCPLSAMVSVMLNIVWDNEIHVIALCLLDSSRSEHAHKGTRE
jgi:hypothetical protein